MAVGTAEAIIYIRAVDLLSKPLGGMAGKLASFGSTVSQVGLALSAGITMPVLAAGAAIVKASTAFDEGLRKIQTISKEADSSLQVLGESFINMSTDITKTTDTPVKLAEAYYDLIQRFNDATSAQLVLAAATKSASAGFVDTIDAAKAIGSVISAYGMSANEATHVSDVLFRTVDRGNITYQELVQNLGDVNSIAAKMGVSLEEVGAATSTMTLRGVPAAEAFTRLKRILISVAAPTASASGAAEEYGIQLGLGAIQAKGLIPFIEDINKKIGNNADALRAIFPRQEAFLGFLDLASGSGKDFAEVLGYISDSLGATDKAYNTVIKSFTKQFESFRNQLLALAIDLGRIVMPMLIQFIGQVRELVKEFMRLPDATKEAIVKFALFAATLGPLLLITGQIIATFGMLLGGLLTWPGAITALLAPIALLAGLFLTWQTNSLGVRDSLEKLSQQAGKLGGVADALKTLFETIESVGANEWLVDWSSAFGEVGNKSITFATIVGEGLKGIAFAAIILKGEIEIIAFAFSFVLEAAKAFFSEIEYSFDLAQFQVDEFAAVVSGIAKSLGYLVTGQYGNAVDAIGDAFKKAGTAAADFAAKTDQKHAETIFDIATSYEYYRDAIVDVVDATKDQASAIAELDLAGIIDKHIQLSGVQENAARLEANRLAASKRGIKEVAEAQTKQTENAITGYQEQGDEAQKMRDKVVGAFSDMLKKGEDWAKKLAPGSAEGLDIFDPHNPSSPFQPFYRIADVAERWGPGMTPGVDTAKWAEMYFPGLPKEEQWRGAMEVQNKLLRGMWDTQLQTIFGPEGVAALATEQNMQDIGSALRSMFAGAIATVAGTPEMQQNAMALAGLDQATINKLKASDLMPAVSSIQSSLAGAAQSSETGTQVATSLLGFGSSDAVQTATDGLFSVLIPAFDKSLTDNTERLAQRGRDTWDALEDGLISAAKESGALYNAVYGMVTSIMRSELQ